MKLRLPDYTTLYLEEQTLFFEADATASEAGSVRFSFAEQGMHVLVRASGGVRFLQLRWNEPARENIKVLGDAWERGYGDLEWRGICPERCMPWYMAVSNGSDRELDTYGRLTECFGIGVQPNALCFWQYDHAGVTLWMDLRNGAKGTLLGERELDCATVIFEEYRDVSAFAALRSFCHVMSPQPYLADHVVYGSNNWYYAYGRSSHEEIISDTKILKSMTTGLENAPYMVIDDGWQPNACDAPWDRGNERFPDMAALAREIKEQGIRPGIWVRYLINGRNSEPRKIHTFAEECYLQRSDKVLDPSHPDVLHYVRETTKRLTGWGYELIKHDFSTFDLFGKWGFQIKDVPAKGNWGFYDPTRTSAEIIKEFYRTVKESAGNAVIIGCNVIGHLCAGLHQLNRTGDDTSGHEWQRTVTMGVNTLAFRSCQQGAFFGADADCVGIMGKIPWEQNVQWLRILSQSGTPLFVSCKPGILSENECDDLRRAYTLGSKAEDAFAPLDWMETTTPCEYLINGKRVKFHWCPPQGTSGFNPLK